jgi:hypothetical protein
MRFYPYLLVNNTKKSGEFYVYDAANGCIVAKCNMNSGIHLNPLIVDKVNNSVLAIEKG